MRRRRGWAVRASVPAFAASCALSSCGTPSRTAPPAGSVVTVGRPTVTTRTAQSPPQRAQPNDPLVTDVPPLIHTGCVVETAQGTWLADLPLRIEPMGESFARVGNVPALLELAPRAEQGGRLRIESDGWALRGRVASADVRLSLTQAIYVQSVTPRAGVDLDLEGSGEGRATLSLLLDPNLKVVGGPRFSWSEPCEHLSLVAPEFDPRKLHQLPATQGTATFAAGSRIQVLMTPKAGQGLTLEAEQDFEVELYESSGNFVRLVLEAENAIIVGWVRRSELSTAGALVGASFGAGGLGLSGIGMGSYDSVTCVEDVELLAQIGEDHFTVGAISAGTSFQTSATDEEWTGLIGIPRWISADSLSVRAADVEAYCR